MIKIRYADLPGGLHARAETRGRDTIVYLLPGLTVPQRRAALHRVRSSARVGHGPRLSAAGIARARAADRMRTNARNAATALRAHPGILAPPVVVTVIAAVAFVLLVPVPVAINPSAAGGPGPAFRGPPATETGPPSWLQGGGLSLSPPGRQHAGPRADRPRRAVTLAPDPEKSVVATPSLAPTPSGPAAPMPTGTGAPRDYAPATPIPVPASAPTPALAPAPSSTPSPSPSPSPSASPGPSGTSVGQSLCVNLLLLGACL